MKKASKELSLLLEQIRRSKPGGDDNRCVDTDLELGFAGWLTKGNIRQYVYASRIVKRLARPGAARPVMSRLPHTILSASPPPLVCLHMLLHIVRPREFLFAALESTGYHLLLGMNFRMSRCVTGSGEGLFATTVMAGIALPLTLSDFFGVASALLRIVPTRVRWRRIALRIVVLRKGGR